MNAYLAAGISSDHEATTLEEALEKRRNGAWILIREASNARNLEALVPMVQRYGPERCAFCTDDREADVLLDEGHIDGMCRAAVRAGLAVEDALVLASHNGAVCHGLDDVGAIAPGYRADFALLPDATLPALAGLQGWPCGRDRRRGRPDRHADAARMDRGHGPHRPTRGVGLRRFPPAVRPCE